MFLSVIERSDRTKAIGLTGEALTLGFSRGELEVFLRAKLGVELADLSPPNTTDPELAGLVAKAIAGRGQLAELLEKAAAERPQEKKLQAACLQARALLELSEQKKETPIPPARRVNLILGGTLAGGVLVWSMVLLGVAALQGALAGIGAWAGVNVVQYLTESDKVRRLDELLTRIVDSKRTTWVLGIGLPLAMLGSCFAGTVQAPPEFQEIPVRLATRPNDQEGRPLAPDTYRWFQTMPWAGRDVTVWAAGYQPRALVVYPWQRVRLVKGDFDLAPFALLTASQDLVLSISRAKPWRLEIEANGQSRFVEDYLGQQVLLGDTDHQPPWVTIPTSMSESAPEYLSFKRGPYVKLSPPLRLTPGMRVTVRPWKWEETARGGSSHLPLTSAAQTFEVKQPGPGEVMKHVMLEYES